MRRSSRTAACNRSACGRASEHLFSRLSIGAKAVAHARQILTTLDPAARCRVIDDSILDFPVGGDAVVWWKRKSQGAEA